MTTSHLKAVLSTPSGEALKSVPEPAPAVAKADALEVRRREGESDDMAVARTILEPGFHSSRVVSYFDKSQFADNLSMMALLRTFEAKAKKLNVNDMSDVEATLLGQATALDVLFSEMARRSSNHLGENFTRMEAYLKLALKAQNQCRMTLETLANVKNPPVVYAKNANINNGQQQINNGTAPRAHAAENETRQANLLEQSSEEGMDPGAQSGAGIGNSSVEAMATVHSAFHRPKVA